MKRLLLMLAVAGALWSAACSGNGIVNPPPPVGKYSKASLNGQYLEWPVCFCDQRRILYRWLECYSSRTHGEFHSRWAGEHYYGR